MSVQLNLASNQGRLNQLECQCISSCTSIGFHQPITPPLKPSTSGLAKQTSYCNMIVFLGPDPLCYFRIYHSNSSYILCVPDTFYCQNQGVETQVLVLDRTLMHPISFQV